MANLSSLDTHQNSSKIAPLALAVFAFLAGLAMTLLGWRAQHFVDTHPDPYAYEAMGRSVLHGLGFSPYGSVLNRRGPLYPLFIALLYFVCGERPLVLQLAQCALLAGISLLAYDMGRRLFNTRTGLIAGLICAINPVLLRYVPDFHVEILLTFLCTLMVWCTVRFRERPTPAWGVAFGVTCALTSLAKAVFVLYPLAFVAYWLWSRRKASGKSLSPLTTPTVTSVRTPWIAPLCIFVAMGAVILPWTLRNHRVSGHWVLITTGLGDAYLRGIVFSKPEYATLRLPPYTYAENESNAYFRRLCVDQGTVWERNDIESDHILTQESKRMLFAQPGSFVRKFVTGIFTFWYQMTSKANSLLAGLLALAGILLALVGWKRAKREHLLVWPLALPILYLNLLLAALLALGRYSVPILPCLTTLAAFGVDTLLSGSSRSDTRLFQADKA